MNDEVPPFWAFAVVALAATGAVWAGIVLATMILTMLT